MRLVAGAKKQLYSGATVIQRPRTSTLEVATPASGLLLTGSTADETSLGLLTAGVKRRARRRGRCVETFDDERHG